ncbi:MAG: cache domain-containing protein, partial [Vicinamibacteria bacterium]|nr:cache domain-containing protein [Vicinamibacteria bacterium]
MKLQGKTAAGILGVFVTLGCCAAIVTSRWESDHAIKGAENRVRLYIKAAWEIYNSKLERIQAAIAILAVDPRLKAFLRGRVDDPQRARALQQEMTGMRQAQGMDILNILDAQGRVVMRSRPPFAAGDSLAADPLVERVLSTGKASTGTLILSPQRLVKEGDGLIETCRSAGGGEQGMMTAAAMPVVASGEIVGIVLMGNLLNGAVDKVDRIRNSVFEGERYQGRPVGTATIFMGNLRISTNVLDEHGRRAVGTRASAEVAERVIEQGRSWNGRAWVVNAWYLSQYDPIHDPQGRVIGMLYMGTLEQLYLDQRRRAVVINVAVILGGMLLAMAVFFMLMRNILSPVRKLSLATQRVAGGDLGQRVEVRSRDEIGDLSASFNSMAEQLRRDQEEIQRSQAALAERNEELRTINRHYME